MNTSGAWAGLAVALLAVAGCANDPGGALPTPAPSPPSSPSPPPSAGRGAVRIGFAGLVPIPGTAVTLRPGTEFVIPVVAARDFRSRWPGVPVRVVTGAPPTVLSVPEEVWVTPWKDPATLTLRALAPGGTYAIHLESPPTGLQDEDGRSFEADSTPLLVKVADPAPPLPPGCDGLSLTAVDAPVGSGTFTVGFQLGVIARYNISDLALRSPRHDTQLRILGPYKTPSLFAADRVPRLDMFALGMDLRSEGGGFEQTLRIAWAGSLRLRATVPGCAPIDLSCGDRGICQTQ